MKELFIVYIDDENIALSKESGKEINIIKDVEFLVKITELYTILEKDFPPKYKLNLSQKK